MFLKTEFVATFEIQRIFLLNPDSLIFRRNRVHLACFSGRRHQDGAVLPADPSWEPTLSILPPPDPLRHAHFAHDQVCLAPWAPEFARPWRGGQGTNQRTALVVNKLAFWPHNQVLLRLINVSLSAPETPLWIPIESIRGLSISHRAWATCTRGARGWLSLHGSSF